MAAPSVCSLLLAAGRARRYGSLKQLQVFNGVSLVRRAAQTAIATGMPLWVVTGAQSDAVHAELRELPLHIIHNAQWTQGMGSSLACGMQSLLAHGDGISAVLIQLVDQPLVDVADLQALLHIHDAQPQAIVAADHGDVLGPPCLFPSAFFSELAALSGDRGARALLQQHGDRVQRIAMPHAALDIDTPDDLARVIEQSLASSLAAAKADL